MFAVFLLVFLIFHFLCDFDFEGGKVIVTHTGSMGIRYFWFLAEKRKMLENPVLRLSGLEIKKSSPYLKFWFLEQPIGSYIEKKVQVTISRTFWNFSKKVEIIAVLDFLLNL